MRPHQFERYGDGPLVIDLNQIEGISEDTVDDETTVTLTMRSGAKWDLSIDYKMDNVVHLWRTRNQPTNLES